MMNPPPAFLEYLKKYDKDNIAEWMKVEVKKLMAKDYFNETKMKAKSVAAANLCAWVVNVIEYNDIYVKVKPLQEEAERAEKEAKEKGEELRIVKEKVAVVVAKVNALREQLAEAEDKKQAVVD